MSINAGRSTATQPVLWITAYDGRGNHAVDDVAMALGMSAGEGRYTAICGETIVADALTAPPGRDCLRCRALMSQRPMTFVQRTVCPRRGHRRSAGLWAALVWWVGGRSRASFARRRVADGAIVRTAAPDAEVAR